MRSPEIVGHRQLNGSGLGARLGAQHNERVNDPLPDVHRVGQARLIHIGEALHGRHQIGDACCCRFDVARERAEVAPRRQPLERRGEHGFPDTVRQCIQRLDGHASLGQRTGTPFIGVVIQQPVHQLILAIGSSEHRSRHRRCRLQALFANSIDSCELFVGQPGGAEQSRGAFRRGDALGQLLGATYHGRRRIVELVRQPSRELAERHQLFVAQVVRRELPRAIDHGVHHDRGHGGALANQLGKQLAGDGEHDRRLFADHIAWRRRAARVRHHAADVTTAPLDHLVRAGTTVCTHHQMPRKDHQHVRRLRLGVRDDIANTKRPQFAARHQPRVL